MKNISKSVVTKIVLTISILTVILAVIQPIFTAVQLRKLIKNIKSQHDASMKNLANNIAELVNWGSYANMQETLIFNLKTTDLVFGHVLKKYDNRSIADANPKLTGEIINSDFVNSLPKNENLLTNNFYIRNSVWHDIPIHEYIVPLKFKNGKLLFFLHTGYSKKRILKIKNEIYTKSLFAVLFSCVLAFGLWLSLKKYIVIPLRSLTSDVKKITENKLDKFNRVGNNDELTLLSDTLNHFLGETKLKQKLEIELAARNQEIKDRKTYLTQLQYFSFWIAHDMEKQILKLPQLSTNDAKEKWIKFREYIGNTCERLKEVSKETETINASIARSEVFDLIPSIKETIETYRNEYPDIEFTLKLKCEKIIISGDPYLLYSCLTNLINNAIDAIKIAGRKGKIILTAKIEKLHAFIAVNDNGCGMDLNKSDLRHRIFMPFFSTKTVSGDEKKLNSGLGLHYVNEIIVAHGGIIRVESMPNQGATFEFNIPLYRKENE